MENQTKEKAKVEVDADLGSMSLEKIGIQRFDLGDPYHAAVSMSWPAFMACLALIYIAINFLFALLYAAVPGSLEHARPGSLVDAFFFSVETFATVGFGVMSPASVYGHVVTTIETFTGLLMTAMMTGLVFVRFSRPRAKILFADTLVVSRSGDEPVLLIRIGNGRPNALMGASARAVALLPDKDANGHAFRRAHDLALQRSDMPFFPMTWTMMHPLREDSPLAALAHVNEVPRDLRLIVSISAHDPSLAATVSALHAYGAEKIQLDMRYVDAVRWDGNDRSVADMRKLSAVEPESAASANETEDLD
ncbi:ion channel [Noviherbaspirillum galbum]|uniref:Potassium channel protein n=1 Tax=Noviherbaspirillum galbum TaxID=2709383 RepID=A0A6B3SVD7_9BURK|nr:ion channel [Noviherbaspirillum galbum]NEX64471.1 hypothetical protein [Noviherbaspirillum galbum]